MGEAIGVGGEGSTGVDAREVVGVEGEKAVLTGEVLVVICSVVGGKEAQGPNSLD